MSFDPEGDCSYCEDGQPIECPWSPAPRPESRAQWLERVILPHEPSLRQRLRGKYPGIDLDEVLQSTYLRLMATGRVDHVKDGKNYLYRAAMSEIIDKARRKQIIEFIPIDPGGADWASDDPMIENIIDSKRALEHLQEAISELPPRQQMVVRMRRIEGLCVRTTSERLGTSLSSIEKLQVSAMRHLAAAMAPFLESGGEARRQSPQTHQSTQRKP